MAKTNGNGEKVKSMESWIWDAACSIRGAADAAKFKDYILTLIFVKRLCDVFDDEIDRIAEKVKSRNKALQLISSDKAFNQCSSAVNVLRKYKNRAIYRNQLLIKHSLWE